MSVLTDHIDACIAHDVKRIAATVAGDFVITEGYGPVYRGLNWVLRWAQHWLTADGIMHRWETTDHFIAVDHEVAQWTFECTWAGYRSTLDGAMIARIVDGLAAELREYRPPPRSTTGKEPGANTATLRELDIEARKTAAHHIDRLDLVLVDHATRHDDGKQFRMHDLRLRGRVPAP